MNAQFLLLLLNELSIHWYFNTSLAFKGLSNKDIPQFTRYLISSVHIQDNCIPASPNSA